jgi:hypothetical protein
MTEEYLFTFAEIAVALIGFSGVVTILGHRERGEWQKAEKIRLQALVEPSIVALAGALLPPTLSLVMENTDMLWRLCNLIVLVMHLAGFTAYIRRSRNTDILLSQKIMIGVAILVFVTLGLSVLGVISQHQFTFALGLLLGIAVAIFNFSLLLFHIIQTRDDAT